MKPIELIKQKLPQELADQLSTLLAEDRSVIEKAIEGSIPVILSGMIRNNADKDLINRLWDLMRDGYFSDARYPGTSAELSDPSPSSPGGQMKSLIFGDQLNEYLKALSAFSGMKHEGNAVFVTNAMVPAVTSILRNYTGEHEFGSDQFATWLGSDKARIFANVPASINEIMDFGNWHTAEPEPAQGEVRPYWWLWLIGVLLVGAYLFTSIRSCQTKPIPVMEQKEETEVDPYATLDSITRLKWARLGLKIKYLVPGGAEIEVPDKGVELRFLDYMDDTTKTGEEITWFELDRILFESGSSKLNPASMDQLNTFKTILSAYRLAQFKIGGYTDNVGDPQANLTLSQARADTVRAELLRSGIDSTRVLAEGYGDQHPVGDNATEEGRELNRRVAIRVLKKR